MFQAKTLGFTEERSSLKATNFARNVEDLLYLSP